MPGKFPDEIAEILYQMSLDGADQEIGDVQETGVWYGLILEIDPEELGLDPTEGIQWAIISEDEMGFVDYDLFDNKEDALEEWESVESLIESIYGVQEDLGEEF